MYHVYHSVCTCTSSLCVCVYHSVCVSLCVYHSVCTRTPVPVCVCIIVCIYLSLCTWYHGVSITLCACFLHFYIFFLKKDLEYAGDVVREFDFAPKCYFGRRLPCFAHTHTILLHHIFRYTSTEVCTNELFFEKKELTTLQTNCLTTSVGSTVV